MWLCLVRLMVPQVSLHEFHCGLTFVLLRYPRSQKYVFDVLSHGARQAFGVASLGACYLKEATRRDGVHDDQQLNAAGLACRGVEPWCHGDSVHRLVGVSGIVTSPHAPSLGRSVAEDTGGV